MGDIFAALYYYFKICSWTKPNCVTDSVYSDVYPLCIHEEGQDCNHRMDCGMKSPNVL